MMHFPTSAQMSVPDLDMEEGTDIYARAAILYRVQL